MQDIASNLQFQLHRMRLLFTLEAQEYEKGRSLQVLQPSQTPMLRTNVQLSGSSAQTGGQHAVLSGSSNGTPTVSVTAQDHQAGVAVTANAQQTPGDVAHMPAHKMQQEVIGTVTAAPPSNGNAPVPLCTPAAAIPCSTLPQLQTPLNNQVQLSSVPLQNNTLAESTPASSAAVVEGQLLSLPCGVVENACNTGLPSATLHVQQPTVQPAVQAVPPLLLQQTSSAPLMQQVLQKQQQLSQPPCSSTQQPSNSAVSNGKRAGHCIEPEALKRMVERQLQMQREKQQLQHCNKEVSCSVSQQQLQQQQSQRLQPQQQHRQRCMTRLPEQYRQQSQQQHIGHSAADPISSSITQPLTIAALQLQPPEPLESPGACLGLTSPLGGFDQALGLDLESSKIFGSAQKRLRLSLCDEVHSGGLLTPAAATAATNLQLSEALVSPVFHTGLSGGLETPTMPAASQVLCKEAALEAAAASAALAEATDMPTPSKFFVNSPAAVLAVSGAASTLKPQGALFCTPRKAASNAGAAAVCKETSATTAATQPLPSPAFTTATKLFVDSSAAAMEGTTSAAAAAGSSTAAAAAGVGCSEPAVVITPSKFLNCSPGLAANKQPGSSCVRDTPVTPSLFAQPASPVWSRMSDRQQQQQLSSSSNPLRTARRHSTDAAALLSSWVPVTEGKHGVQLPVGTPGAAATAAESTPMNGHVPVALFQTPPTAAAAAASGVQSIPAGSGVLDPAAAAAVPVDIDAIRRGKNSAAAAAVEGVEKVPVAPSGVETSEKEAAEAPAVVAGGMKAGLLTPPLLEQQVTATPLTQVV